MDFGKLKHSRQEKYNPQISKVCKNSDQIKNMNMRVNLRNGI
jgi:hypothetical protein